MINRRDDATDIKMVKEKGGAGCDRSTENDCHRGRPSGT